MARLLTFKMVEDYMRDLQEKNVDLNDFIGTSVAELATKMSSASGLQKPVLILYQVSSILSGNDQRTFNTRKISFIIAYNEVDPDDFDAITMAKANAEAIGLEVLSRINYDSKKPETPWLYNKFIKDTIEYDAYEDEEVEGLVGMDFSFEIKVPEPLVATPAKWTDGNTICNG